MNHLALLGLFVAVGIVTFVYRYSMIGLFASGKLPGWLHALCRHIAPASFAALTATALFVDGGDVVLALNAPKPWAALLAALVAWHTRNVIATIASGMLALTLLKLVLPL
ncbi:AzlD domain-containing protein [Rhodocyclus tenuis]|uniref:AzlD domain-containing protein n=1 Tax=Rhodocyclus tenuis TaxID=1066 RepID=UPI0019067130|nr:AzlD domain-containing protein [Rhodocyclus tenuis]MBK1679652.1 integrase [Rhodocyclus tenuis]